MDNRIQAEILSGGMARLTLPVTGRVLYTTPTALGRVLCGLEPIVRDRTQTARFAPEAWVDLLNGPQRIAVAQNSTTREMVGVEPAQLRTVVWEDGEVLKDVGYPPIVWFVRWKREPGQRDQLLGAWVSVVAGDQLPASLDDPLPIYPFPYGNCSSGHYWGAVCWGSTDAQIPYPTLESVQYRFWGSGFNHDIWGLVLTGKKEQAVDFGAWYREYGAGTPLPHKTEVQPVTCRTILRAIGGHQ